ncbi:acyltransferase [Neptunomonas sp.]|uniref:acyltransferase family protein n=1 Tax=Neptunomonas sp. TaxID=1971898 RepID=UPI0025FBD99B|nr:acyltransferase [Neptunomonas sp.]
MTKNNRFEELDVFRGLAALSVVLFHYTTRYDQVYQHTTPAAFSVPWGHLGVQFFFIISGFVIFMTLEKCHSWKDFSVSRLSRLYPAYWAAVLLTFTIGYLFPLPDQNLTFSQLIVNLTMLQSFFYVPAVDGVYWSLAWELNFYFVMLFLFLTSRIKMMNLIAPLWLSGMIITYFLLATNIDVPWRIQTFFVLQFTHLFIAGIYFYKWKQEGISFYKLFILLSCLAAELITGNIVSSAFSASFFILFSLAINNKLNFIKKKPLIWLGSISYTLYLVHQMIGFKIIYTLEKTGLTSSLSIFIALIVSICIANIISSTIEKPSMLLIRSIYNRK